MKHNIYKTITKENVKYASNRQIKMYINDVVIEELTKQGLKQNLSKIDIKKEINKILGKDNQTRIQKVKEGILDIIL